MTTEQIITTYLIPAAVAILTALAGWLGAQAKKLYEQYINDKIKRSVVRTAVKATEQLYHDLGGDRKLSEAIKGASEMLAEKNIPISDLELRQMIEAVVSEFNYGFGPLSEPTGDGDAR